MDELIADMPQRGLIVIKAVLLAEIGVSMKQRVAWLCLDSNLCTSKTQPAPLPWNQIGKN